MLDLKVLKDCSTLVPGVHRSARNAASVLPGAHSLVEKEAHKYIYYNTIIAITDGHSHLQTCSS